MKKLVVIIFLLVTITASSQTQRPSGLPTVSNGGFYRLGGVLDTMQMFIKTDTFSAKYPTLINHTNGKLYFSKGNGAFWNEIGDTASLSSIYVRRSDSNNVYLTPFLASQTYVAIQTQPPTASLSGGSNIELHSAGIFNSTLNWSAGRAASNSTQNATNPLASIVVNGINQTFTQPSAGSSVSGTQAISLFYNTNRTVFNVVTTTDGKTATATTQYNFFPKYYIGYSTTSTPSDADLIAGINTIFPATTRVTSGTLASPASSSYIFFAVPATFGTPVVTINAAGVTYNNTTRSVTNASGYTQSYIISISPFATAAGVSYSIN